jgi:hypothetical protein
MKKWIIIGLILLCGLGSFSQAAEALLQLGKGSGEVGTQHNVVQVSMTNDTSVIALQLAITDVPDFIKPDTVWMAARAANFMVSSQEDSLGVFHILIYSFDKTAAIAAGSGAILNIGYTVEPGAANFSALDLIFYTLPTVVVPGSVKIPVMAVSGKFIVGSTAVESRGELAPEHYSLGQNFPNPFNPSTRIAFQMPRREKAMLEIFNVLGQRIRTLVNEEMSPGLHEVMWDGLDDRGLQAAGGVYLYRMRAGSFVDYKRMAYMR